MFYFDKQNPNVLFCDIRSEVITYPGEPGRTLAIVPDMQMDFRDMPLEDESFHHIIFDPPHLTRNGANSRMGMIYGTLPRDGWREYLKAGFDECWRVLAPLGTLVFKWNELDISTNELIKVLGRTPIYCFRSGKTAKTHMLVYVKVAYAK